VAAIVPSRGNLTPLTRGSVTREVAAQLFEYLDTDDLRPGTRLPSERNLADALQVPRSAIRETLAALEVLGIVDIRPGSGAYLRQDSSDLLPTVINWGLALGQPRTLDLVEARSEMEPITAKFAAERASAEDLERLAAHLEQMRSGQSDFTAFIDADVAFHLEVADIAGNTVLADILHSVRSLLKVWIDRAVRTEGDAAPTLAEHQQVFDAIASRDPAAAEAAMRAHMVSAGDRLKRSLENPE
jgi:DNA-binding FadR family transcriptional regulator